MRARRVSAALPVALLAAPMALAALDDVPAVAPFETVCTLTLTCRIDGGCADLPAPGEQIVTFDGTATRIGQSSDTMRAIERFGRIEDLHPLPVVAGSRRSILVDLPPEREDRRFALFVQRPTPEGAAPVLQPVYFVLACWDAAP